MVGETPDGSDQGKFTNLLKKINPFRDRDAEARGQVNKIAKALESAPPVTAEPVKPRQSSLRDFKFGDYKHPGEGAPTQTTQEVKNPPKTEQSPTREELGDGGRYFVLAKMLGLQDVPDRSKSDFLKIYEAFTALCPNGLYELNDRGLGDKYSSVVQAIRGLLYENSGPQAFDSFRQQASEAARRSNNLTNIEYFTKQLEVLLTAIKATRGGGVAAGLLDRLSEIFELSSEYARTENTHIGEEVRKDLKLGHLTQVAQAIEKIKVTVGLQ